MKLTRYAISTGHPLATDIALEVLQSGGNAIDAGVAASIALTVLHSEQVSLGGVAPMLIQPKDNSVPFVVEGAGCWPATTDPAVFVDKHRGRIPKGILRTVVPAAPQAWVTALARFGTMGFARLAAPAVNLAVNGFPAHDDLVFCTTQYERLYRAYPENTRLWLPDDRPLKLGEKFVQMHLGQTLQLLIEADLSAVKTSGRLGGLQAVNDTFYKGPLAKAMVDHVTSEGGWLTQDDLASYETPVVPATGAALMGGRFYSCGRWSQGPTLTQTLKILETFWRNHQGLAEVDRPHIVLEAMKLALADREAYLGDLPDTKSPLREMLSQDYIDTRAREINPQIATPALPEAGVIEGYDRPVPKPKRRRLSSPSVDTSVACVIDGDGNVFASTPSDMSFDAPAVPNLGFVMSTRGGQSRADTDHPASVQPLKRPRVSACPFLYQTRDGAVIAGGGPGADLQLQAMTQVLDHHFFGGIPLSDAVQLPRVFSQSAPTSSAPHMMFAGQVLVEEAFDKRSIDALTKAGHNVQFAPPKGLNNPSICLVARQSQEHPPEAIGDPRRLSGQRQE